MTDENTEDYIGEILITITDRIYIKSEMSPEAINLWLDRAKLVLVTGELEPVEAT